MSIVALALIIISAFMHATWNYLAKQSRGGFAFVWLYMLVGVIALTPVVAVIAILHGIQLGWLEVAFMVASAFIHIAYALTLQKGYRIGDLSLVYPVARGTGPMIVAVAAIFIFDERLTALGALGILFIIGSIFVVSGGVQAIRRAKTLVPLLYGMLIGLFISGYTLVDKGAVGVIMIAPIVYFYGGVLGQVIVMSPVAVKQWDNVRRSWRVNRKEVVGVGLLSPFAYILVLIAMTFTPVSHVAPVREISILIGAIIGTRMLHEEFGIRRIIAAVTMVVGVIAVAASGG